MWRITQFHLLAKHEELINEQCIEFISGSTILPQPYKWKVYLKLKSIEGKKKIGVVYARSKPCATEIDLLSQMSFSICDKKNNLIYFTDGEMKRCEAPVFVGSFPSENADELPDSLEIHLKFKLVLLKRQTIITHLAPEPRATAAAGPERISPDSATGSTPPDPPTMGSSSTFSGVRILKVQAPKRYRPSDDS